ncbi:hypothetical protein [Hirschia maritima]|uniref:hypothetical protein n=1 Tax=Hirschia maritima TaxID=1121961 RepID=UPI00037D22DC|nr:hypothetical protein [Hirschia maritima]
MIEKLVLSCVLGLGLIGCTDCKVPLNVPSNSELSLDQKIASVSLWSAETKQKVFFEQLSKNSKQVRKTNAFDAYVIEYNITRENHELCATYNRFIRCSPVGTVLAPKLLYLQEFTAFRHWLMYSAQGFHPVDREAIFKHEQDELFEHDFDGIKVSPAHKNVQLDIKWSILCENGSVKSYNDATHCFTRDIPTGHRVGKVKAAIIQGTQTTKCSAIVFVKATATLVELIDPTILNSINEICKD